MTEPDSTKRIITDPRKRELAGTLKDWRVSAGLAQQDIADALNCTYKKISHIENFRRGASWLDVRLWAKATGRNPSDVGHLISGEGWDSGEEMARLVDGFTDAQFDVVARWVKLIRHASPAQLALIGKQADGLADYMLTDEDD